MTADGMLKRSNPLTDTYPVLKYHYFLKDHLGNVRVVFDQDGIVNQVNNYYPFGMECGESAEDQAELKFQDNLFGGKEFNRKFELNMYDFGARNYDGTIGRWTTPDTLAKKYYSISPYAYCFNNPIRFFDFDGRDPGDFFLTKNKSAKDWGMYYNGASIRCGREYASSIYSITKNGKKGYTYTEANIGFKDHVKFSSPPKNKKVQAIIHSHGNYDEDYINNDFSSEDKWVYYDNKVDGYVATPNGSLLKYDVESAETNLISSLLPFDSHDPDRKMNIESTDSKTKNNQSGRELWFIINSWLMWNPNIKIINK